MSHGFDPEIVQDFLTESGELLEQLEGDLIALEDTPQDPGLLNQVFRALHTIKGSASFLALTNLVSIAHAAETALSLARSGGVEVDRTVMDLLLEAIDQLKVHFEQLTQGADLVAPDPQLVAKLTAIGEGRYAGGVFIDAGDASESPTASETPAQDAAQSGAGPHGCLTEPLHLDSSKEDLVDFLVDDVEDTLAKAQEQLDLLASESSRADAASLLLELTDAMARSIEFFEFESMLTSVRALVQTCEQATSLNEPQVLAVLPRLRGLCTLIHGQCEGLRERTLYQWDAQPILSSIETIVDGSIEDAPPIPHDSDGAACLSAERVWPADPAADATPSVPDATADQSGGPSDSLPASHPAPVAEGEARGLETKPDESAPAARAAAGAVEKTIRVEVNRLEALMNLVGELVLQKNRIGAVTRQLQSEPGVNQDQAEAMGGAASNLDRVTADIQLAVMRTRMQPLDKIFGKYPRLIRDLARKTQKGINLVIEGGDTEVDKSVIEELADPLVHILRNAGDHGIESPAERLSAGKDETGTIRLSASHEGSHVQVRICDDGKGLPREVLLNKAIERGLTTEQEARTLSDSEVFRFIFAPGFSTAAEVSDLSGRGVGMDVVRTNIEKLKGAIDITSEQGRGTEIIITIPLTVAIMPAMMVGVGEEIYAIPLSHILQIVRPQEDQTSSIGEHPVMRTRDGVLPLLNAGELFGLPESQRRDMPFAVVLSLNEKRIGLLVSHLIGQQEIVIKPLEDSHQKGSRPVNGATVRDDGGVSLIADIAEIMRIAEGRELPTVAC